MLKLRIRESRSSYTSSVDKCIEAIDKSLKYDNLIRLTEISVGYPHHFRESDGILIKCKWLEGPTHKIKIEQFGYEWIEDIWTQQYLWNITTFYGWNHEIKIAPITRSQAFFQF